MKREDAEEFTQAIGQSVSGAWRTIAVAKKLGVPEALGLSTDDWVTQRIGGYVRLSAEDRRKAVAELRSEGNSARDIAEVLGVDHATVARDARVANATEATDTAAEFVANATGDNRQVDAREARKQERIADIERQKDVISKGTLRFPEGLFHVVSIDPTWPYGTEYDPEGRRAANPYPEMSLREIASLNVPAAKDCVLWLWTTHRFMRDSFAILDGWGFRDVSSFTTSGRLFA